MNSGYSRKLEYEADAAAASILRQAGYPPGALVAMLENMAEELGLVAARLRGDAPGAVGPHRATEENRRGLDAGLGERAPEALPGRDEVALAGPCG